MYIHKTYCLVCAPWNISQFQSPKAYCPSSSRAWQGRSRSDWHGPLPPQDAGGLGGIRNQWYFSQCVNIFLEKKTWFTNSHNSLPWNSFELIWIIPLMVTIIPVRSQWGRDDLPRYRIYRYICNSCLYCEMI
jgi:hypothetical protein